MKNLQLGYHVSHEQFSPQNLLELVQLAESAGFQFALSSDHISAADMDDHVDIATDAVYFIEKIRVYQRMGFSKISIHNVNKNQKPFIRFFGKEVLPYI